MAKLCQIIAVETGLKPKTYAAISALHKIIQKPVLFNGFSKTYQAVGEGDEKLPAESQRVQNSVDAVLNIVSTAQSELFNTTARKDFTNCVAKADVVVEGKVIIKGAPVSYLLFMEKQLNDLRTFAAELPVLDPNEEWKRDENSGLFKAEAVQTHRTKKTQRPIVLYDATERHPAQTQLITEDVIAGFWTTVKQSGAIPKPKKDMLINRIDALSYAVKQAREEANTVEEVNVPDVGKGVFDYLYTE